MEINNEKPIPEAEHRDVEIQMPQVSLAGHLLVQRGLQLVCMSCPYEHSYFLPPNLKYTGNDENGMPMTEKI